MRHADRGITDPVKIEAILRKCELLHLAMTGPEGPYALTVNFGVRGGKLYFHSATTGKKTAMIEADPRIAFCAHTDYEPVRSEEKACKWSAKYHSVAGQGLARFLTDPQEKLAAFKVIMAHHTDLDLPFEPKTLDRTVVVEITPAQITGMRKGYEE